MNDDNKPYEGLYYYIGDMKDGAPYCLASDHYPNRDTNETWEEHKKNDTTVQM